MELTCSTSSSLSLRTSATTTHSKVSYHLQTKIPIKPIAKTKYFPDFLLRSSKLSLPTRLGSQKNCSQLVGSRVQRSNYIWDVINSEL
ncbi:unnamed protein product [Linum trigynum]|uniref:Uncharacterized protein n=1 Tax=Linum trigynum TaxID=586398 RepID=A0AAV2DAE6_9ROSI